MLCNRPFITMGVAQEHCTLLHLAQTDSAERKDENTYSEQLFHSQVFSSAGGVMDSPICNEDRHTQHKVVYSADPC